MAEPPDLEARIAALEAEVRELASRVRHSEQDAASARVMAGGARRDVVEIRELREQNSRVISAVREDLTELRQEMRTGLGEIRSRLDATAAGQQRIAEMLATLIAQRDDHAPDR
ncbi:MAG: permease [Pseudonocardia sp.]|nr:permease [Pseudonocardia sp.]MBO0873743.1 permease [Pseudonocardia sp.]